MVSYSVAYGTLRARMLRDELRRQLPRERVRKTRPVPGQLTIFDRALALRAVRNGTAR